MRFYLLIVEPRSLKTVQVGCKKIRTVPACVLDRKPAGIWRIACAARREKLGPLQERPGSFGVDHPSSERPTKMSKACSANLVARGRKGARRGVQGGKETAWKKQKMPPRSRRTFTARWVEFLSRRNVPTLSSCPTVPAF